MAKSGKNSNKKSSTPASRSRPAAADRRRVYKVGAFDVLMGRGGNTNNNRGNVFFRKVVVKHRYEYQHQTKAEKPRLIDQVIAAVQQAGGQFLVESGRNENNKAYYSTASYRDIRKKTAQALREKTHVRPLSEEPTKKDSPVLVKLKMPVRPAMDKKDHPSYRKLDPPPLQKHRVARRFTRSALRLSSDGPVTPSSNSRLMTNNREGVPSAFYKPIRATAISSKRASMDDAIDDNSSQKRHRLLDSPNDMAQDMKELLSIPLVISPMEMAETPSPPQKTSSKGPAAGAIMVSKEHNQVPCLEKRGEPSPPNGFLARMPPGRIMVQRKRILLPSSPALSSSDTPPRVNGENPISPPPIITPRVLPMQARGVLESVPEECAVNNVGNDTSPDLSRMLAEYESMSGGKNRPHHTSPTTSETSLFSLQTTTPSPNENSMSLDGLPVLGAQLAPHRSVRLVSEMLTTSLLQGKMVEEVAPSSSASKLLLKQHRDSFEVGFLPIHPHTEALAGSPTPPIKAMHNLSLREGSPAPMAMFASRSPSGYGSNPTGGMAVLPHLDYLSTPSNMQVSPNHHPLHQLSSIHSQATGHSHTEWKISPLIPLDPSSFGKDRQDNDSSIDKPHKKAKTSKILKFNDDDPNSPLHSQHQKIDSQIIMYKTPERNHPACVEIRTRRILDVTGQATQPTCSEDAPAARLPLESDVSDGTRASSTRRVSL